MDPTSEVQEAQGPQWETRRKLVALSNNISRNTFDIAELLSLTRKHGFHYMWGEPNLWVWAEKELGIKQRKGQYLVRIVETCELVGISRSFYEPVGVSKLREITRLNPKDFYFDEQKKENVIGEVWIRSLVYSAHLYTTEELQRNIAKLLGLVGDDEMVWWNVPMKRIVKERIVERALELARRLLGSAGKDKDGRAIEYSNGAALEVICAEFIVGNQDAGTVEKDPQL